MYVVCVTVLVESGKENDFVEATLSNARNTRQEPGNRRFDVLQSEADPCQFFLYEVYRSPEAFASHQQTEHYLHWSETVADWMARPRQGVRHLSVFPSDSEW